MRGALNINDVGAHLRDFLHKMVTVGDKQYTVSAVSENYLQFSEIRDRDAAAQLTNQLISVPQAQLSEIVRAERNNLTPKLDELYYFEMIGLEVADESTANIIGTISAVSDMGENSIITVDEPTGTNFLVPLNYPHWGAVDLIKNQVSLNEWNLLRETQFA